MVALDATRDDSVTQVANDIQSQYGHIDILFNNAGISGTFDKTEGRTADESYPGDKKKGVGIARMKDKISPFPQTPSQTLVVEVNNRFGSLFVVNI
ncbi:short-chain dehydrogenase, partial [Staphylococcus pettenkoferi]